MPPPLRSIRLHTTLNPIMLLIMLNRRPRSISKIEKTASLERLRLRKKNLTNLTKKIILLQKLLKFLWHNSSWVAQKTTYLFNYLIRWLNLLIFLQQHSPQECSLNCHLLSIVLIQDHKNWQQKDLSLN